MKFKKIISVLLAIALICVLFSSCGTGTDGESGVNTGDVTDSGVSGEDDSKQDDGGSNDDASAGNDIGSSGEPDKGESGGASEGNGSLLSGTPKEILEKLIEDIAAAGIETPMCVPPMPVAPDMSQNTIGLPEEDFNRYVSDCAYTMAAIGTFAHQVIVIEASGEQAAAEIKRIAAGDNGYDAKKWICVFPEKAVAVESGVYVLIIASTADVVDAAVEAFVAAAGSAGAVDTFWEFAGDADGFFAG